MKKLILIIMVLLLLCACAKTETEQVPSAIQQVSEDESKNIVFSVDKIKDLGEYENTAENYSRYYDEFVGEFIPSDDYGEIIPFIGGLVNEESIHFREFRVGFCTVNGEIVCDAVYDYESSVCTDNYIYYIVRIPSTVDSRKGEEYPSSLGEKCLIIRSDGKKVIETGYLDYGLYGAVGEIIFAEERYMDGKYYNSRTIHLNEDLELIEVKPLPQLHKSYSDANDAVFMGFCGGCGKIIKINSPIVDSNYYSNTHTLKGHIHAPCKGGISVISTNGKLLARISDWHEIFNEELNDKYFFCTIDNRSEKYQPSSEELTAYVYDIEAKTAYSLAGHNLLTQIDKSAFAVVKYNDDEGMRELYSYDVVSNTKVNLSGYFKISDKYIITAVNGVSRVLDKDYNELFRIRLTD